MTRKSRKEETKSRVLVNLIPKSELDAEMMPRKKSASRTRQRQLKSLRMTQKTRLPCSRSKSQAQVTKISLSKKMRIWLLKALASLPRFRVVKSIRDRKELPQIMRKVVVKSLALGNLGTMLTIMRSRQLNLRIACMRLFTQKVMIVDLVSSDQR